jgi:hypothetical protein
MIKVQGRSSGVGSRKARTRNPAEATIGKLRSLYGQDFASGMADQVKLKSARQSGCQRFPIERCVTVRRQGSPAKRNQR